MWFRFGLFLVLILPSVGVFGAEPVPEWIWHSPARKAGQRNCLSKSFDVRGRLLRARLRGVADYCQAKLNVNSKQVAHWQPYAGRRELDVTEQLKQGRNKIVICCQATEGPGAVFLRLDLEYDDGHKQTIVTNKSWHSALPDVHKSPVSTFGRVARFPWGDVTDTVTVQPIDDYEQWKAAQGTKAGTDPATFQLLPGFEIELLRSAQPSEDSWICMAFDPQGRIVVAREKQGLLRFTLPKNDNGTIQVETIDDKLKECRGLLFAHDSLYAMANNDKALYRLRDTNGDDRFDRTEKLKTFAGDVGHGRNQLVLGPDDKIYCLFGDSVFEPSDAKTLPPTLVRPTAAEKTRSGFLARTNAAGKKWEVVTRGLRNPFGIAFNTDGEFFTYDADAEYDMGSPWYRPTRVDHLISGSDFGWRRVTKQWPPYVPDRPDIPQSTLDIGKGSPTAVTFGSGSAFPPAYREALFILDWAYGRILAVHLSPWGSSYAAKAESFLRGRPANVTDIEFGPAGAMYFVTGGRGTQSALYRVQYSRPENEVPTKTVQQQARWRHAISSRTLRRTLEGFHGRQDSQAIKVAWPHLNSVDPWIRHAARIAVEWQPVGQWKAKALAEERTWAKLQALLALSRMGEDDLRSPVVQECASIRWDELTDDQKLTLLFINERFSGDRDEDQRVDVRILKSLNAHYPDRSPQVNRSLSLLLHKLKAPRLVERTLPLLAQAANQQVRMHYLFMLRDVKTGWTSESRRMYFDHLRRFGEFVGGDGMPTFRRLIETEALQSVPDSERAAYEKLLRSTANPWLAAIPQENRKVVRQWKLEDVDDSLDQVSKGRNFKRGQRMFAVGRCILCHRISGRGGVTGPDLNAISSRFRPQDVLVSILEPSKVVSEKYRSDTFALDDGRVITGRLVPGGDFRSSSLRVATDPLDPTKVVEFAKSTVELHKLSSLSPMPKRLVDTLTREEILDLLAYVNAAGRKEHPSFRGK
jgi:putative heme-binding domain-containing protein